MHNPASVLALLDEEHIAYELTHHQPLLTCDDALQVAGIKGHILKNLLLNDKHGHRVLFSFPCEKKADLKKLSQVLGLHRFSFGKDEELAILGITRGAVTPLALLNDVDHHFIWALPADIDEVPLTSCHPLTNTQSIDIATTDLIAFVSKQGHEPVYVEGCLD